MALQDSITYLNDLDLAIQHTVGIEQLKWLQGQLGQ